ALADRLRLRFTDPVSGRLAGFAWNLDLKRNHRDAWDARDDRRRSQELKELPLQVLVDDERTGPIRIGDGTRSDRGPLDHFTRNAQDRRLLLPTAGERIFRRRDPVFTTGVLRRQETTEADALRQRNRTAHGKTRRRPQQRRRRPRR